VLAVTGLTRRSGRVAVLVVLSAVVVGVLTADSADAKPSPGMPVEHVAATVARHCKGAVDVAFTLQVLGRDEEGNPAWVPKRDDRKAIMQVHGVGAWAGPGGMWVTVASTPDGHGHLRSGEAVSRPTWDLVRVVHGGIASTPILVTGGCAGA
jgi:hypothetical protein